MTTQLDEWTPGSGYPATRSQPGRWAGLVIADVVVVGLWVLLLLAAPVAAVIALVVAAPAMVVWVAVQGRIALKSLGARPLVQGEQPRLENLASHLADDLGRPQPALWVVPASSSNALAVRAGRPSIAVTTGLIEKLTRTELEAVLAHSLLRLDRRSSTRALLSVAGWPLTRSLAPAAGTAVDLRTVAVTRYPPGLVGAIGRCDPRDGRQAPFWFVATGPSHDPPASRIAELEDL